jgi:hypothetical protein
MLPSFGADDIPASTCSNFPVCIKNVSGYIHDSRLRVFLMWRIVQGWMYAHCSIFIHFYQIFCSLLASVREKVSVGVILFVTLSCLIMGPIQCSAASLCMPVPTLQGIGHVCIDVGNSEQSSREQESIEQIPSWVNAQQIPCGSDGNVFTRAGFRPQTLLQDTVARIKGAAAQRLEVIRSMEALSEDELKDAGPMLPRIYTDVFSDPFEDRFGVSNIPRSQILADTIDPFVLTFKTCLVAVVFRRLYSSDYWR